MITHKHKIIILRHGETAYNADGLMVQDFSVPLNEKGLAQANDVVEKLTNFPFEQIITSKLTRAIQTGDIVSARLNITNIYRNDIFNERDSGILKGLHKDFIKTKYPELWNFEKNHVNYRIRPHGGENLSDLSKRVDTAIGFLNSLDRPTLIVSHGGFIRNLLSKLYKMNDDELISKLEIPNCSFFELN